MVAREASRAMDREQGTTRTADDLASATMTLADVAEELGVHYMTVYRYVRIGKLPAVRRGRIWLVDPADVELLRAGPDGGDEPAPQWDLRFQSRLAAFDDLGAWQVVEATLAGGRSPVTAYLDIVIPALERIGHDWEAGRIGVAESHAATNICWRIVGRLGLLIGRPGMGKGSVVLACAPGEAHHLPCAIAAGIFRSGGFDVIDCGSGVPSEGLIDLVGRVDRLAAVGISSTRPDNQGEVVRTVAAVKDRFPGTLVMAGGAGAGALPPGQLFGADVVVESAFDGLAELVRSAGVRSGPRPG